MVVLWDIDGTLVRASIERHFFAFLREHHPKVSFVRTALHLVHNAITSWPPLWYQMKVAYLRGLSQQEVEQWFERCWPERIVPQLFPGSIEAVRLLQQRRVRQVLLTGGPRPLADRLADFLQLNDVIAADPVTTDSIYTGAVSGPHPRGRRKVAFADRWLREHGFDWHDVTALGNHCDDRFLLKRASTSIAVNPDLRLSRLARIHGWTIVDPQPIETGQQLASLILASGNPTAL